MILSEYFMGKNISWDRCLSRFISLLVPFLFWNFIVSFEYDSVPYMHVSEYLCRLVGYQSLFVPDFNPLGVQVSIGQPFSTPTWFLRDLLLCFLATHRVGLLHELANSDQFHQRDIIPICIS